MFCEKFPPTRIPRNFHSSGGFEHEIPVYDLVSLLMECSTSSPLNPLWANVEPFISFPPK